MNLNKEEDKESNSLTVNNKVADNRISMMSTNTDAFMSPANSVGELQENDGG